MSGMVQESVDCGRD